MGPGVLISADWYEGPQSGVAVDFSMEAIQSDLDSR
jgi:hypothetical protein